MKSCIISYNYVKHSMKSYFLGLYTFLFFSWRRRGRNVHYIRINTIVFLYIVKLWNSKNCYSKIISLKEQHNDNSLLYHEFNFWLSFMQIFWNKKIIIIVLYACMFICITLNTEYYVIWLVSTLSNLVGSAIITIISLSHNITC